MRLTDSRRRLEPIQRGLRIMSEISILPKSDHDWLVHSDRLEESGYPLIAAAIRTGRRESRFTTDDLAAVEQSLVAEAAANAHKQWQRTFFARCGVIGNRWSVSDLTSGIRRRRGRAGAGSRKYAQLLGERLQQLADRRWARAIKGQRGPTPRQALQLAEAIRTALRDAQGRCSARTMDAQDVISVARCAARDGRGSDNGGTVTCGSYGYSWTTTECVAVRQPDGTIQVTVRRSFTRTIVAPARHWQDTTVGRDVLKGGGAVGIRRKHGWDVYDASGDLVGVAIPQASDLQNRWGKWEHGATVADAQAEIERKQQILRAEAEETERRKLAAEQEAKRQARIERAARLLSRIGTNLTVGYDDARAVGACEAGLRAFGERVGLTRDARLPLAEVAKLEPTWAVKLARRLVSARMGN